MFKALFLTAWRNLSKSRIVAFLNIGGIAVGVATCLLIAVWVEREVSFDQFHPNGTSKFRVSNTFKSESETFSQAGSGVALGSQLPKHVASITGSCRVFYNTAKFSFEDRSFFESNVIIADSNFFSFFGFPLVKGQPENALRGPTDIVLTERAAIKYFGDAASAMGKIIMMDKDAMTVSGVASNPPLNSHIQFDIATPYAYLDKYARDNWQANLDEEWLGGWPHTYVEIGDPAKWKEAELMINQVVERFSKKAWEENRFRYDYFMTPVTDIHLHSSLRYDNPNNGSAMMVKVFSAVAVFILLLACINYINLTTATALQRAKEISLRKVAGAGRAQLVRQFFAETLVTCSIAVLVAMLLLQGALPFFSVWMGQPYSFSLTPVHVITVVGFVLGVSFLSGFYPSIVLSSFNPLTALRGRFAHSSQGQLARKTLVIVQFTISTVLLIAILTVHKQMEFIRQMPLGYTSDAVITIDFNGEDVVQKNYDAIRNELMSASFIHQVSGHNSTVVGGLGNGWTSTINQEGKEVTTSIYRISVDETYFDTYGMELAAGRTFTSGTSDTTQAVLVNEAAVKTLGWPSVEDALGKPFGKGDNIRYVIGVVKDFHFESLHKKVEPVLIGRVDKPSSLSIRAEAPHLADAIAHLQQVWAKLAPGVPLQYSFIDDSLAQQYGREQKMEAIFYVFAGLSLLIACMGLFGLSIFMMQQRVKEIGIRKVLGAKISGIVVLLSTDFGKLVLLSVIVAIPLGWYLMNQWLSGFAYHTRMSGWIFGFSAFIPLVIALFTVSIQSVKAALTDPVKSLRAE